MSEREEVLDTIQETQKRCVCQCPVELLVIMYWIPAILFILIPLVVFLSLPNISTTTTTSSG